MNGEDATGMAPCEVHPKILLKTEPYITSLGLSQGIHLNTHTCTSTINCQSRIRFCQLTYKYFRRVSEYERAYIEGKKAGKELEQAVKVF